MQNTSTAVMARRVEPPDSLDYFPTPGWATRALCEWLKARSPTTIKMMEAWEPACGEGHMASVLWEYFRSVKASDVFGYGHGDEIDFLWRCDHMSDWIITNPPFRVADQFARLALERANQGVALLVRTAFLEGVMRHATLFSQTPPTDVLQFSERVPMLKGRVDRNASTATSYCWLVWRQNMTSITDKYETILHWLPPCRKKLERDEDYR